MTLEQQIPGGGIAVPESQTGMILANAANFEEVDIDLGSPFALELGFPLDVAPYLEIEEEEISLSSPSSTSTGCHSPSKKKKKKNKKKKK
jgi:hypothetical protein